MVIYGSLLGIGRENYRFFFLFLFSVVILESVVVCTSVLAVLLLLVMGCVSEVSLVLIFTRAEESFLLNFLASPFYDVPELLRKASFAIVALLSSESSES